MNSGRNWGDGCIGRRRRRARARERKREGRAKRRRREEDSSPPSKQKTTHLRAHGDEAGAPGGAPGEAAGRRELAAHLHDRGRANDRGLGAGGR
jgi:hypothetical protein